VRRTDGTLTNHMLTYVKSPAAPFWQNEIPLFLRAESMPCTRARRPLERPARRGPPKRGRRALKADEPQISIRAKAARERRRRRGCRVPQFAFLRWRLRRLTPQPPTSSWPRLSRPSTWRRGTAGPVTVPLMVPLVAASAPDMARNDRANPEQQTGSGAHRHSSSFEACLLKAYPNPITGAIGPVRIPARPQTDVACPGDTFVQSSDRRPVLVGSLVRRHHDARI